MTRRRRRTRPDPEAVRVEAKRNPETALIIYIKSSHTPSLAVATKRLHNTLTRGNVYLLFLEAKCGKIGEKGKPGSPLASY